MELFPRVVFADHSGNAVEALKADNHLMKTATLSRKSTCIIALCVVALGVSACATPPSSSQPSSMVSGAGLVGPVEGALTPEEANKQVEERTLQEGLIDALEDEDIPGAVGGITQVLGKEQAESAFRWAVAVARSGMYVNSLWNTSRPDPLPFGAEVHSFASFMDKAAADEWLTVIADQETLAKNLSEVTSLVIIPQELPAGATWFSPAVRDWRFELVSARASAENEDGVRDLELKFTGTGTAGYAYEGKYYQFTVTRDFAFVVRPSPEASKEWELIRWTTSEPSVSEVVESTEAPRDVLIPEPHTSTVTEGTARPDPNYPELRLPEPKTD